MTTVVEEGLKAINEQPTYLALDLHNFVYFPRGKTGIRETMPWPFKTAHHRAKDLSVSLGSRHARVSLDSDYHPFSSFARFMKTKVEA